MKEEILFPLLLNLQVKKQKSQVVQGHIISGRTTASGFHFSHL